MNHILLGQLHDDTTSSAAPLTARKQWKRSQQPWLELKIYFFQEKKRPKGTLLQPTQPALEVPHTTHDRTALDWHRIFPAASCPQSYLLQSFFSAPSNNHNKKTTNMNSNDSVEPDDRDASTNIFWSLVKKYDELVLAHTQQVTTVENTLRSLSYFIPGELLLLSFFSFFFFFSL